jgi:prepilin-type N-terminal cleavage/methylation domain-containing protein
MKFSQKKYGFTLLEIIIALSIAAALFLGVSSHLQGFGKFNSWLIQYTDIQKKSFHDILIIQEHFNKELTFIAKNILALNFEKILARTKDSLEFNFFSVVSDTSGKQISLIDTEGYTALHSGSFSSTMVQVGTNLFFLDTGNHIIRKINLQTEVAEIFVGELGVFGDDNTNNQVGEYDQGNSLGNIKAHFRNPTSISAHNGNLYVTDTGNHTIRLINITTKVVTTFAGNSGFPGDAEGPTTKSFFHSPQGITINTNNGEVYVSDTGNHKIKKISSGIVQHFLGSGEALLSSEHESSIENFKQFALNHPTSILYDNIESNLYVNDYVNKRILQIKDNGSIGRISHKDTFFSGIKMFQDPQGIRFIEIQETDDALITQIHTQDLSIRSVLNAEQFAGFNKADYIYQDFIRNNNDIILLGIKKTNNTSSVLKLQDSTNSLIKWYGDGGIKGQTKLWDETAYIFNDFFDIIGKGMINKVTTRNNIIGVEDNKKEVLLQYLKKHNSEKSNIQEKYSIIIGK